VAAWAELADPDEVVTIEWLFEHVLHVDEPVRGDALSLGKTLRSLGYRKRRSGRGDRGYYWAKGRPKPPPVRRVAPGPRPELMRSPKMNIRSYIDEWHVGVQRGCYPATRVHHHGGKDVGRCAASRKPLVARCRQMGVHVPSMRTGVAVVRHKPLTDQRDWIQLAYGSGNRASVLAFWDCDACCVYDAQRQFLEELMWSALRNLRADIQAQRIKEWGL